MSSVSYIPLEGERVLARGREYYVTNYRLIQYDNGSRTTVSLPWYLVKEYKLLPRTAMFKVVNGIVNIIGAMPKREEVRAAVAFREFENLTVGEQRKLCEISGAPFVHPDHPYNRWITVGYHQRLQYEFYRRFAWIKGEEVFTYYPDAFILTNYRLYQYDAGKRKLYLFPLHMIHTFEARRNRLRIQATTGTFDIRGTVVRQDHLLRMWQQRAWDALPSEHLEWLLLEYSTLATRHPLSQYAVSDTSHVKPTHQVVEQDQMQMEASSSTPSGGTVLVKPQIKSKCENCGAPMSWETIDWVGPDQYACPSCGHSHNVDYVRI